MPQGQTRSVRTNDLNYIFFKIRETRCPKTRRSWQRRARLALAQLEDLTPSERHEIACTWSQLNAHQIDSPALSKLHGKTHAPSREQTIKASSLYRRSFDVKKPTYIGLASNEDHFTEPCNDDRIGLFSENTPLVTVDRMLNRATFEGVFSLGLTGDSVDFDPSYGNRERPHPRRERKPDPKTPKLKLKIINASLKPPLNKSTKFAVDNGQTVLSVDAHLLARSGF